MFDKIYEWYVNYRLVRLAYQAGFFISWAIWAYPSIKAYEVTWLLFGWLPSLFWPVALIAAVPLVDWTMLPTQLATLWMTYQRPIIIAGVLLGALILYVGYYDVRDGYKAYASRRDSMKAA